MFPWSVAVSEKQLAATLGREFSYELLAAVAKSTQAKTS